jgi:hypothetical protein
MKRVAVKTLNAVEMSGQEAAWYLLRQPMCQSSRSVVYIPTVWLQERQKTCKRRRQMDEEGLDDASTNVWLKGLIERYEESPTDLEEVHLADFAAWYTPMNAKRRHEDDESEAEDAYVNSDHMKYRRRDECRVVRYTILQYRRHRQLQTGDGAVVRTVSKRDRRHHRS